MSRAAQAGVGLLVLLAGFGAGRFVADRRQAGEVSAGQAKQAFGAEIAPRQLASDLDTCLCEISAGNISAGRARIAALLALPGEDNREIVKLLVAIAMKDGATFDQVVATLPDARRTGLVFGCLQELAGEPVHFFRLLAESEEIARAEMESPFGSASVVVRSSPSLFMDLVESGRLDLPAEFCENIVDGLASDKSNAFRFLSLCQSGQMKVGNEMILAKFIFNLGDKDLATLVAGGRDSDLSELLRQETKARGFFDSGDLTGPSWSVGRSYIWLEGMKRRIEERGLPEMRWSAVPEGFRQELAGSMLAQAIASLAAVGVRGMLNSISGSDLSVAERDGILAQSARMLFEKNGDIGLAVEYANRISTGPDGNAGEDLIVRWVTYDPANARAYADKIEASPLKDRILARIAEVTP